MSSHLARVLAIHLDPVTGSPYWLERERECGFDFRSRIHSIEDLALLGPFDLGVMLRRPMEDFIPLSVRRRCRLIRAETGGTTGTPKPTVYTGSEFQDAFIQPFLARVDSRRVFTGGHWLWLGPSGPHIIGQAARRIALLTTRSDPFSVDFDPRWYRRLAPGSLARSRYLAHLIEQATNIIAVQDIRYLFATPTVLRELLFRMNARRKLAIRFVYLGGMPVDETVLAELADALPQAEFLAGYGNTLFGVCHESAPGRGVTGARIYFPDGPRLVVRVVPASGDDASRIAQNVADGERGQLVMHRLDASCFLPGVMERDLATQVGDAAGSVAVGFADPRPPATNSQVIDNGIY